MAKGNPNVNLNKALTKTDYRAKKLKAVEVATAKMPDEVAADPVAAAKWKELEPLLVKLGIFTVYDSDVLQMYVTIWSQWLSSPIEEKLKMLAGVSSLQTTLGLNPGGRAKLGISTVAASGIDPFASLGETP